MTGWNGCWKPSRRCTARNNHHRLCQFRPLAGLAGSAIAALRAAGLGARVQQSTLPRLRVQKGWAVAAASGGAQ